MTSSMTWRDAVAELTAERQRAEAAARIIKRLGGTGTAEMEMLYAEGRAETEAVISALAIAVHQGSPSAYPDGEFDARLARAVAARELLTTRAGELAAGHKGIGLDFGAWTGQKFIEAFVALWNRGEKQDAAVRDMIVARLELARWPAFSEIVG